MNKIDWKHIALGLAAVVGSAAVHYLIGVDWSTLGVYAPVVAGALQILNEVLTGGKPTA